MWLISKQLSINEYATQEEIRAMKNSMKKIKVVAVTYDFTANTMPVLFALEHYHSYPIPDKSKKPIYSDIFFDSENSLFQAEQKRNRKKLVLEKSLGGKRSTA